MHLLSVINNTSVKHTLRISSVCHRYNRPHLHTLKKMEKPQILLLSSSKVHGYDFLEYASDDINDLLKQNNVSTVLFVPYAQVNHDAYLEKVSKVFNKWGYQVEGIHKDNPREALDRAEAIFVGGGNTFLLLNTLYELDLLLKLSSRVAIDGVPYIGSSAGSNVASLTINNTNDMPIIHPPSFKALQLIPFNINPHYIDADKSSTHMGETREERILQFQELPHSVNVLGLREGAHLLIKGQSVALKGIAGGRLFPKAKAPRDVEVGSDLTYLLTGKIPN